MIRLPYHPCLYGMATPHERLGVSRAQVDRAGSVLRAWMATGLLAGFVEQEASSVLSAYRAQFEDPLRKVVMGLRTAVITQGARAADLGGVTAAAVSDGLPMVDHVLLSRAWVDRFSARDCQVVRPSRGRRTGPTRPRVSSSKPRDAGPITVLR